MLLRAYRLTDRLTLVLLKAAGALSVLSADGLIVLFGSPVGRRSGILGILGILGSVLWRLLLLFGAVLAPVIALAARLLGIGMSSTASGYQGAMARRAARSDMRSAVQEDPLRARNRALSALLVIALAVVIGVVLWATQPRTPAIASLPDPNLALITNVTQTPTGNAPVAIPTPIPTATQLPQVLQSRGTVAFSLRENGQTDLWAVPITSRTPIRLTNDSADERDPIWSPDGTKLAYSSNRDGNWELYIFDFLTEQTRQMTFNLAYEGSPSWSPDSNWLVYETYQTGNLDIYVLPVTDVNATVQAIVQNPSGDMRPAWSPQEGQDGRLIAFVSWRDGNGEIYVLSLDDVGSPFNLTGTVAADEDYPSWSPNGLFLAYSAVDAGIEKVFVKSMADPAAPPMLIGRGRAPSWSPDGSALIAAVDTGSVTDLTVYSFGGAEAIPQIIRVPSRANRPSWTAQPLPSALVNAGGLPAGTSALYVEQETRFANGLYPLGILTRNVQAPQARLSDRVNDSFNALRERVNELAARDFLGRLDDAFWDINDRPQLGEEIRNWHKTGRAFSINKASATVGFPREIEVFREDTDVETRWRVFVRVGDDAQFGQRGEPLRGLPWDFDARGTSDVAAYEAGGRVRDEIPAGYYVDLTEIAADYGWTPYAAGSDWRLNFNAINYWLFIKPDGLDWLGAMREIWPEDQLGGFVPTPRPSESTQSSTGG
ncbi:MAG: PD40 domain-containing protein [Chloroflexi bacterium]|nr:PD40 domain-containing protein [Chloroflexota bacterium]